MVELRLNRYVAKAAGTSRREADRWIEAGRITVNHQKVIGMGMTISSEDTQVELDGKALKLPISFEYLMLNKPVGYLVTAHDPQQRQTIYALLSKEQHHLYSIGRLDQDSCGLLLLTNDGELTQRLLHPRYKAKKTYHVRVRGLVTSQILEQLCSGIELSEGKTQPAEISLLRQKGEVSELQFVLREGKKRQIRRMCKAVGLFVEDLKRLSIGSLQLGQLKAGESRALSLAEVEALYQEVGLSEH